MFQVETLLVLIPALPLAAAMLTAALGPWLLRQRSHWPTVVGLSVSCAASLLLVLQLHREIEDTAGQPQDLQAAGHRHLVRLWTWGEVDRAARQPASPENDTGGAAQQSWRDFRIEVVLRADSLTAIMLATVTFISLLVAVYSIGYMHDDPGYWRFFSYIALFVFSMTMLVSVSNFVMLYVFWEAVGLCSYLLIGFWYERPAAAAAGKKAFLVNRIGDFGFALGVFLLWTTYGTLDFHDTVVNGAVQTTGLLGQARLADPNGYLTSGLATPNCLTAICLLLFLGACGKSAQFPLHVWLPDAMEGPTPVSALIHAATMVTAGVYLVARCMPLFLASADAQCVVAVIGGVTALLAAVIALTQTDLKRILAYSTISQLGYMFLALGTGAVLGTTAGMFHLVTHAFFKALLFLGAGSVMHAMGGVIDIDRFGGLRRRLPVTHWTFLVGCLGLAGVWPLAGFWSKDLILVALGQRAGGPAAALYGALYLAATVGAGLTAFYSFRAYFRTFWGEERLPPEAAGHAHESPKVMLWPLIILSVGTVLVGAALELGEGFAHFLAAAPPVQYAGEYAGRAGQPPEVEVSHWTVAVLSQVVALAGIALAGLLYLGSRRSAEWIAAAMRALGLYTLSREKLFLDEIYQALVVLPARAVAQLSAWADRWVIDSLVDLCGAVPKLFGAMLRPLQNGLVPFYALAMILGLLVLIGALLM